MLQLLERAAAAAPDKGLIIYPAGEFDQPIPTLSYPQLLHLAKRNAQILLQNRSLSLASIVLLYFESHLDSLTWYWSVIAAGKTPVICSPLTNDLTARRKQLEHLYDTLEDPVCILRKAHLPLFDVQNLLNLQTIEGLHDSPKIFNTSLDDIGIIPLNRDLVTLMLTSGSTGNSKIVVLQYDQILRAVSGKSLYHCTAKSDVFLNWIDLNHVANLTEIHLHAMLLGADQVHVQAKDLLTMPIHFVTLLARHKISYTFAPNFFLASLERELSSSSSVLQDIDLRNLRALISGGEANRVETVLALSRRLRLYGAPENAIRPGFGMTETCAGCIYGLDSPRYDIERGLEFASLGACISGVEMRVVLEDNRTVAKVDEIGNLQVRGPVVFAYYYRNAVATQEARTKDGWFHTGDQAFIDNNGNLNLTGRKKETIIVNGVHYSPHELEAAIEEAAIEGARSSYTVVFPYRRKGQATEDICVVYLPTYADQDMAKRAQTSNAIARVVALSTGVKPYDIVPLSENLLQKSSLGKLSRTKIQISYKQGEYDNLRDFDKREIATFIEMSHEPLDAGLEIQIARIAGEMFNIPVEAIDANTSIMSLGITSIELIKLKQRLQTKFRLDKEISITQLITEPSIRGIGRTISELLVPSSHKVKSEYNPVVVLKRTGTKTALWLVHPGIGEVLVFISLADHISDRPVYALRAKGFADDEPYFSSIGEATRTYKEAIKRMQPKGPYAIAGYSYGAMLAFEITKALETDGDKVLFLGSLNLPPHIAFRMQQLDWITVLLNLAYFISFVTEDEAHKLSEYMFSLPSHATVLDHLLSVGKTSRLRELDLNAAKLMRWTDLAHHLQSLASSYEPSGRLENGIDVFVAEPLRAVASDREEWVANHLSRWGEFCTGSSKGMRLHHVNGSHYTMINNENVASFTRELNKALAARGI